MAVVVAGVVTVPGYVDVAGVVIVVVVVVVTVAGVVVPGLLVNYLRGIQNGSIQLCGKC